jgi:DHA1 family multidrug resistance protein-like MFS transporter
MASIIRDAPFGQIVRLLTNNKYFQYPEEKPDFKLPDTWLQLLNSNGDESDEKKAIQQDSNRSPEDIEPLSRASTQASIQFTEARLEADEQHEIEKIKSIPIAPKKTKDGSILVDWYYTDDLENPHNWSNGKRAFVTILICLYTFVVYTTSAIYTSSTEGVMKEFGVSTLVATLGLSLYVLGYGTGPLVFSPLSEIPVIGRNPVYIITMFLFVIISIPTAFVGNFAGLMVLRFLQGFFGSPCLASGGASIGDMYSLMNLPFAMMAWVAAAYCGRKSSRPTSSTPNIRPYTNKTLQPPSALSSAASPSPSKAGAGPSSNQSGPPPQSSS